MKRGPYPLVYLNKCIVSHNFASMLTTITTTATTTTIIIITTKNSVVAKKIYQ